MKIHLVDGTYELFRAHFGAPPSFDPLRPAATSPKSTNSCKVFTENSSYGFGGGWEGVKEGHQSESGAGVTVAKIVKE
jgi:hypothetical protein